jgi:hypothetical protein
VAARLDIEDFKADTMVSLEQAGFPSAALALACNTWPVKVWPELMAGHDDPDGEQRKRVVKARDQLVTLLFIYEVSLECDSASKRVKVMGKDGVEVGISMKAPSSLRRWLAVLLDEEKRTW